MLVELVLTYCIHKQTKIEGRPVFVATATTAGDVEVLKQVLPSFLKDAGVIADDITNERAEFWQDINGGVTFTLCPKGYYFYRRKV